MSQRLRFLLHPLYTYPLSYTDSILESASSRFIAIYLDVCIEGLPARHFGTRIRSPCAKQLVRAPNAGQNEGRKADQVRRGRHVVRGETDQDCDNPQMTSSTILNSPRNPTATAGVSDKARNYLTDEDIKRILSGIIEGESGRSP